jgi:cytochrome c
MRKPILLLTSLLTVLYGCQPEAPEQKAATSAAPPAATEPAKQPVAVEAAAPVPAAMPQMSAVPEDPVMQLAKKNNCLACHAVDKKVVGPAWKDVAAKYRGDKGAEELLMAKIASGGSGVWGSVVMPPYAQVSEADRRTLVKFVLSLK